MNLPINASHGELTMSSLEIAELCGKEHRNVLADTRKMLEELDLGTAKFSAVYQASNKQQYECFNLPRRECDILIAGYSIKYRAAIVDRWHELEAKNKLGYDPSNEIQVLEQLLTTKKQVAHQAALIEQQKPAVDFAIRIASASKGVKLGNFAKAIGIGPNKIFEILRGLGVLMTAGDRYNMPYQVYIDRGYFAVRQSPYEFKDEIRISHTTLITGKGENWVNSLLINAGILKAVAVEVTE